MTAAIFQMNGFWNTVAGLGQGGAGAVLALIIVFYFQSRQQKNGSKTSTPFSVCAFLNADSAQVRAMEIGEHVTKVLGPKLDAQTELLQGIRDGVRDMRR